VYVEPDAREIGIGDALVLHAIDFLRSQKATWIGAQAQPGDRALKNLFERHGLVAQTIIVGRPVIDPSTEVDASQ
jgi:GNAT superfamily N-acetyltransferase